MITIWVLVLFANSSFGNVDTRDVVLVEAYRTSAACDHARQEMARSALVRCDQVKVPLH